MRLSKLLKSIRYDPEDDFDPNIEIQAVTESDMFHPSAKGIDAEIVQAWLNEKSATIQVLIKHYETK